MKEIGILLNENLELILNFLYWFFMMYSLSRIIGWKFIFSIIENPKSFKPKLADYYALFLVSVLNHGEVPDKFFTFTLIFGFFLSRKIIYFFNIPLHYSIFVVLIYPFLNFLIFFLILYGYFYLSLLYPKTVGKKLIDFLETHAQEKVLEIINLKKRN
nr:hypothetical protein [Nitzschia traheaformis]